MPPKNSSSGRNNPNNAKTKGGTSFQPTAPFSQPTSATTKPPAGLVAKSATVPTSTITPASTTTTIIPTPTPTPDTNPTNTQQAMSKGQIAEAKANLQAKLAAKKAAKLQSDVTTTASGASTVATPVTTSNSSPLPDTATGAKKVYVKKSDRDAGIISSAPLTVTNMTKLDPSAPAFNPRTSQPSIAAPKSETTTTTITNVDMRDLKPVPQLSTVIPVDLSHKSTPPLACTTLTPNPPIATQKKTHISSLQPVAAKLTTLTPVSQPKSSAPTPTVALASVTTPPTTSESSSSLLPVTTPPTLVVDTNPTCKTKPPQATNTTTTTPATSVPVTASKRSAVFNPTADLTQEIKKQRQSTTATATENSLVQLAPLATTTPIKPIVTGGETTTKLATPVTISNQNNPISIKSVQPPGSINSGSAKAQLSQPQTKLIHNAQQNNDTSSSQQTTSTAQLATTTTTTFTKPLVVATPVKQIAQSTTEDPIFDPKCIHSHALIISKTYEKIAQTTLSNIEKNVQIQQQNASLLQQIHDEMAQLNNIISLTAQYYNLNVTDLINSGEESSISANYGLSTAMCD